MKLSRLVAIGAIVFTAATAHAQSYTTVMNPGTRYETKVTCHSAESCFELGDSMARTDYAELVNECYDHTYGDESRLSAGTLDEFYNCIANDEPENK